MIIKLSKIKDRFLKAREKKYFTLQKNPHKVFSRYPGRNLAGQRRVR